MPLLLLFSLHHNIIKEAEALPPQSIHHDPQWLTRSIPKELPLIARSCSNRLLFRRRSWQFVVIPLMRAGVMIMMTRPDLMGSLSLPELVVQQADALLDLPHLLHQPRGGQYRQQHVHYHGSSPSSYPWWGLSLHASTSGLDALKVIV